ncbi:hypothetical protein ACFXKS_35560 [Streptomyces scopuliridis]|uniref:hypothetical protein n=1 Tax=Streptomyces scopuliridis TaxID=452529 RepID=UPI003680DC6B
MLGVLFGLVVLGVVLGGGALLLMTEAGRIIAAYAVGVFVFFGLIAGLLLLWDWGNCSHVFVQDSYVFDRCA